MLTSPARLAPLQVRNGASVVMRAGGSSGQRAQKGRWKGMDAGMDMSDDQQDIQRGRQMVDGLFQGGQGMGGTHNAIMTSADYLSTAQRNFDNIEDGFYIAPAFLDKMSIHVAKVGEGGWVQWGGRGMVACCCVLWAGAGAAGGPRSHACMQELEGSAPAGASWGEGCCAVLRPRPASQLSPASPLLCFGKNPLHLMPARLLLLADMPPRSMPPAPTCPPPGPPLPPCRTSWTCPRSRCP